MKKQHDDNTRTEIRDEFGARVCDVIDTPNDRIIEVKVGKKRTKVSLNAIEAQAGPRT